MDIRSHLLAGQVIPAHPLALTADRVLDEAHQRALTRYYVAAGAGGIAVGVHTTQFAIRERGLYRPVLELASETADDALRGTDRSLIKVAGICGRTAQAVGEAETARSLGYHAGLLSLSAWCGAAEEDLLVHCRETGEALPLFGFYLQPAVGGRTLSYRFWRRFCELPTLLAIKIAPFNRYQTLDVVRAVADSGRDDVALYTGNDDNIVVDLLTPFGSPGGRNRRIVGGLLGHWACWTLRAVELLQAAKTARETEDISLQWLTRAAAITDANSALFDAANGFAGSIPGIHEALRRQGLLRGIWCLDPNETLSPGQMQEIDRVLRLYPEMRDDTFVEAFLDDWLR
jgi:dihydrodipicolinate synthase/N-acetylneuraminate lyase